MSHRNLPAPYHAADWAAWTAPPPGDPAPPPRGPFDWRGAAYRRAPRARTAAIAAAAVTLAAAAIFLCGALVALGALVRACRPEELTRRTDD